MNIRFLIQSILIGAISHPVASVRISSGEDSEQVQSPNLQGLQRDLAQKLSDIERFVFGESSSEEAYTRTTTRSTTQSGGP